MDWKRKRAELEDKYGNASQALVGFDAARKLAEDMLNSKIETVEVKDRVLILRNSQLTRQQLDVILKGIKGRGAVGVVNFEDSEAEVSTESLNALIGRLQKIADSRES